MGFFKTVPVEIDGAPGRKSVMMTAETAEVAINAEVDISPNTCNRLAYFFAKHRRADHDGMEAIKF